MKRLPYDPPIATKLMVLQWCGVALEGKPCSDGWLKYWFYHKVHLVEEKNLSGEMVKRYPLAEKMGKSAFECKPTFEDTRVSKTVEKAYKLGASL